MTTTHATYDVRKRTTVKAVHTRAAPPKAEPHPAPREDLTNPPLNMELIGDKAFVYGVMNLARARTLCDFLALLD